MRFSGTIFLISMLFVVLLTIAWFVNPGTDNVDGVAEIEGVTQSTGGIHKILTGENKRAPKKNIDLGEGKLRGRVRNAAGVPVAGATIQVMPIDPDANILTTQREIANFWECETDAQGMMTFRALPEGDFVVSAAHEGAHAVARAHVVENGAFAELTLQLEPSVTLQGNVVDGEGAPVVGALVYPVPAGEDNDEGTRVYRYVPVKTDESGKFKHPLVPAGDWDVLVVAPKFATRRVTLLPSGKNTIALNEGEFIQGRLIRAEDQRPLSNTRLLADAVDVPEESHVQRSNGQGFFRFTGLRAAAYVVHIDSNGYVGEAQVVLQDSHGAPGQDSMSIRDNVRIDPITGETKGSLATPESESTSPPGDESDTLLIEAVATGAIRGQVLESGVDVGVPDVYVSALVEGQTQATVTAKTDLAGYYSLKGLPEGTYQVRAPHNTDRVLVVTDDATVNVVAGKQVDGPAFRAESGEILRGEVKDSGRNLIGEANVYLRQSSYPSDVRGVTTGEDGSFVFRGAHRDEQVTLWAEKMGAVSEPFGPAQVGDGGLQGILLPLMPVE